MTATCTCSSCGGPVGPTAKFCRTCRSPIASSPRPVRRHNWITIGLIILVVVSAMGFCAYAGSVAGRVAQTQPEQQNLVVQKQPEMTLPTATALPPPAANVQGQEQIALAPLPIEKPKGLAIGSYEVKTAVDGSGGHPDGDFTYQSPSLCASGCGAFEGILEVRSIRVAEQGFVLDLQIRLTKTWGDMSMFGNVQNVILDVNGQRFVPAESNFPAPSIGLTSGYFSFYENIPLNSDGQYKIMLTVRDRLQPVEGWLLLQ